MQPLEVSGAVRPPYRSSGVKGLILHQTRTASTMHSMTWFHLKTMSIFPPTQIPIFKATQPPTTSISTNQSIASTIILDRDAKCAKM